MVPRGPAVAVRPTSVRTSSCVPPRRVVAMCCCTAAAGQSIPASGARTCGTRCAGAGVRGRASSHDAIARSVGARAKLACPGNANAPRAMLSRPSRPGDPIAPGQWHRARAVLRRSTRAARRLASRDTPLRPDEPVRLRPSCNTGSIRTGSRRKPWIRYHHERPSAQKAAAHCAAQSRSRPQTLLYARCASHRTASTV